MRFEFKSAATAVAILYGSTAGAAVVDFTDASVWSDGTDSQTIDLGGYDTDVSLSAVGGDIIFTPYDGPNPAPPALAASGLVAGTDPANANDGIGITPDDEISNPNDRLTVTFSKPVLVSGFSFLDLFKVDLPGLSDSEAADVFINGDLAFTFEFPSFENFSQGGAGFLAVDFAPVRATKLEFAVAFGNDPERLIDRLIEASVLVGV